MNLRRRIYIFLGALILIAPASAPGQSKDQPKEKGKTEKAEKADKAGPSMHLRIEVTGGEKDQAVEGASVYVKYVQERALGKDRKIEMNLKTNREGVVKVPEIPRGKVLVQVVAEGWKPFGRWYNIEEDAQTLKIHLEKPLRWY